MPQDLCRIVEGLSVEFEASTIIQLLGFMVALGFQTWAIVRYMIARMDHHREKHEQAIVDLHNRLNGVKDDYVKRSDLDRDIINLQGKVVELKSDINLQMNSFGQRLDSLVHALRKPND